MPLSKNSIPPKAPVERWHELAEKASKERDPKKLLVEIEELCDELERREKKLRNPAPARS